jgi:predicted nucleic acid-binding Zn ribbon protein
LPKRHGMMSENLKNLKELVELVRVVDPGVYLDSMVVAPDEVDWSLESGYRDLTAKVLERLEAAMAILPCEVAQAIKFDLSPNHLYEHYFAIASFSPSPLSIQSFSNLLKTDKDFFYRWANSAILEAAKQYERFRSLYIRIYELLDYLERREQYPEDVKDLLQVPQIFNSMVAFAEHALILVPDELTTALNGTDLRNLKRCPVCGRVFWLSRKDQKGCTRACAKVLRTRRWRERTTAEQRDRYKVSRIIREMKKEEKRNGSI